MTLKRTVRIMTILLVIVACMPVYLSGELPLFIWPIVGLGLGVGWFVGGRTWPKEVIVLVTALLIASLALMVFLSIQTGDWLVNSIIFTLLATVARSLQLQTARQLFQLVGLSFLILVAAAVTNPDPSFALYFLVYSVVLTWALTYAHLAQRVEESAEASGITWKASEFVSRRFLLGSSVLALVLLISSTMIFVLFPRLGMGFFSAQTRKANPIVGFSDSIELGHFGNLEESGRVVMRVEFGEGKEHLPPESMLKFRGVSFEHYDGHKWIKMHGKTEQLRQGQDGYYEVDLRPALDPADYDVVEYDIYQEPLETESKVLFVLTRPLAIRHVATRFDRWRGTAKKFYKDGISDLSFTGPSATSTNYTVRSALARIDPERLRASSTRYRRVTRRHYLQLPPDMDGRIAPLARQAADGATNPYDIAANVEQYLAANYGYTLEGEGIPEDPISAFLFERRQGHCQYFASSMVLMLRTLGVPARPVNGFLGATYNSFGNYYTVSEGSAHSWVEVYFRGFGWLPFEPTPAVERLPEEDDFIVTMELWYDALKLRWYKWVVEYDLEKQLGIYAGLWNTLAPKSGQVDLSPGDSISKMRREMKKISRQLFSKRTAAYVVVFVLLFVLVPFIIRRWLARRRPNATALDKLAARARTFLRRKGLTVVPGSTLPGLVREAAGLGFEGTGPLARLVAMLEEARWSAGSQPDMPTMHNLLRQVSRSRSCSKM